MLLLTIIHLLKPEERLDAFKIAKARSKEIIKVGTTADKPNKEGTLRELGQVWHALGRGFGATSGQVLGCRTDRVDRRITPDRRSLIAVGDRLIADRRG